MTEWRSLRVRITEKKVEKLKKERNTRTDIIASDVVLDNSNSRSGSVRNSQSVWVWRYMYFARADRRSLSRLRNVKGVAFAYAARYSGGVQIPPRVLGVSHRVS